MYSYYEYRNIYIVYVCMRLQGVPLSTRMDGARIVSFPSSCIRLDVDQKSVCACVRAGTRVHECMHLSPMHTCAYACEYVYCVCVCVRACLRVRACVYVCARTSVRAYMLKHVGLYGNLLRGSSSSSSSSSSSFVEGHAFSKVPSG